MAEKTMLLISNSKAHGGKYLDHCQEAIKTTMGDKRTVVFLPYARPSGMTYNEYTSMARVKFEDMGFVLTGIHEYNSPRRALEAPDAIFVGGGNTFVLLNSMYENGIMDVIRERVDEGMIYMGASAGTNVAGRTIMTTNDNPIVYPPSFNALGLVDFIFKPHYLDPDPNAKNTRETDETRIKEYHLYNDDIVVGLREGSMLQIRNQSVFLCGTTGARMFFKDKNPIEVTPDNYLGFLLRRPE